MLGCWVLLIWICKIKPSWTANNLHAPFEHTLVLQQWFALFGHFVVVGGFSLFGVGGYVAGGSRVTNTNPRLKESL